MSKGYKLFKDKKIM